MKKYSFNTKAFTFIEVLLSLTLFSIIMMTFVAYFSFHIKRCNEQIKTLNIEQNIRYALNYIEKNIRECNHQRIIYYPDTQIFEGKNDKDEGILIDLSGKKQNHFNTEIYFYKAKGQLRTNKKGEHNVLVDHIKDIAVKEIIENKLIEVKIIGDDLSLVKATFKINN